jgi:hypothetical protein
VSDLSTRPDQLNAKEHARMIRGHSIGAPPTDPVDILASRVGSGTDDATRERALRAGRVGVGLLAGNYKRELFAEPVGIVDRWLAAKPGSPERAKAVAQAAEVQRLSFGHSPFHTLACVLVSAEPGRVAGAAVAHAARDGQAVAQYFIPNLIRALDAAGFHVVEG